MSDLFTLAAKVDRILSRTPFGVTVSLEDAAGTTTRTSPDTGTTTDHRQVTRAISRVMATAHPGAVVTVNTAATGETSVLAAPGGAYDGREITPAPVTPDEIGSPSPDLRPLTVGTRLSSPTRAVRIITAGDIEVRTLGTPGEFQPAFAMPVCMFPIQILELGPNTTAEVIGVF